MRQFVRAVAPVLTLAVLATPFAALAEKREFRLKFENRGGGVIEYPDGTLSTGGNDIRMRFQETRKYDDGYKERTTTEVDPLTGESTTTYDEGRNEYARPASRLWQNYDGMLCDEGTCYSPRIIQWKDVGREIIGCRPGEVLEGDTCKGLTNRPVRRPQREYYPQTYGPQDGHYRRVPPSP